MQAPIFPSTTHHSARLLGDLGMIVRTHNRNHVPLAAGVLVFLVLIIVLTRGRAGESVITTNHYQHSDNTFLSYIRNPFGAWKFDVRRDGDNYSLSPRQCAAAFPKLYSDVEEMVSRRKGNPITKVEFDSVEGEHVMNSVRAMIHDGELYVVSDDGMANTQSRGFATLHAINRALLAYPDRARLPNCEFRVYVGDIADQGNDTLWVYTKHIDSEADNLWLMPDFGFYDWPEAMIGSYTKSRRDIRAVEEEVPWEQKKRELIWRGYAPSGYQTRVDFLRVTQNQPWANVVTEDFGSPDNSELLPIADFCRWMFVADIKGNAWSGGAKYKHNCRSVFISHSPTWREIYTAALVDSGPSQNWVSVADDWSNLAETVQDLIAHPAKAKKIADNGVRTLRDRYLTPAAETCYWRRLIEGYASVSFEPDFYERDGRTWRGTPFSSVALMGATKWEMNQDSLISLARNQ